MREFDLRGSHALITGASAGIGRELARQLTGRAASIVLVARRRQRLEELRDELTARDPNLNVLIRQTDLSKQGDVIELYEWIEREKIVIDFLINNAGLGDIGLFATSDPDRVDNMMQVNMTALTLLTRRLLPAMIARKRGAILNVSSSASFLPIAGFAVYAASKAYVTSFSEALRVELHGSGVGVTALCPGPVDTEFSDVAKRSAGGPGLSGPRITYVAVEAVARAALYAVTRNKPLVIPGVIMKLGMFLVRLTPLPVLRLASRFSGKL